MASASVVPAPPTTPPPPPSNEQILGEVSRRKTVQCACHICGVFICMVIGGLIFHAIESGPEYARAVAYEKAKDEVQRYLEEIHNATQAGLISNASFPKLKEFVDGNIRPEQAPDDLNFNIPRSIFFTLTIMSTIGYGSFTAQTGWGKAFTAIVSLCGVAYFGLVLSHTSERVIHFMNFLREKLLQKHLHEPKNGEATSSQKKEKPNMSILLAITVLYLICFSFITSLIQREWGFGNSFYFCIITFSTVGLGDYYPRSNFKSETNTAVASLVFAVFSIIGLSLLSAVIASVGDTVLAAKARLEQLHLEELLFRSKISKKFHAGVSRIEHLCHHDMHVHESTH